MTFVIRTETDKDSIEIYQLIKTAFETANVRDGDEQDLYKRLRNSHAYIVQLSLVAENNTMLIGHMMLTRFNIKRDNFPALPSLLLAPVSVQLEHRNQHIGSALIKEGIKRAEEMGFKSIIVLGDPDYYSRFGFRPTTDFNITCMQDIPARYVQALELTPDALRNITGKIDFDL